MAADQYYDSQSGDPNQTNTSNGDLDWWTQNQPPPTQPPGTTLRGPGVYENPDGSYIGQNGKLYDAQGNEIVHAGVTPTPGRGPTPDAPTAPTGGGTFGGPVAPFQYNPSGSGYPTFTPPPLPDYLQKGFQLPSAAELQNTPGYMERFQMGQKARERSAAAHGTILNGGTQQALTRYGQDYASGEYGNLVGQKLQERGQQASDYLNLAYGPAWQSNTAAVNQYGTLYKQYQDLNSNNRLAQNDYWLQQMDLLNAGLGAAKSGSPGSTGGQG